MKNFLLCATLMAFTLGFHSCIIVKSPKKDNGKHKGWFKNRHNPHNPNTNNPGQKNKNKGPGNNKKFKRVDAW